LRIPVPHRGHSGSTNWEEQRRGEERERGEREGGSERERGRNRKEGREREREREGGSRGGTGGHRED
jgi:hypothetical protein